jgi:adenylylsulfate kinase
MRQNIRKIVGNLKFVYVKCSLEECERRDVKGMYKKARENIIKDFTGISSLFEEPNGMADIIVDSEKNDVESCIKEILSKIGLNQL